ncbi:MAG: hypothetical protein HUK08_09635, partial [Bacteroidaceae bacterium]|nr:hypothetical protein [Bacteroidaceae bacterium]
MKKLIVFSIAALVMLASCSKESKSLSENEITDQPQTPVLPQEDVKLIEYTLCVTSEDTKVNVDSNTGASTWEATDKVYIFNSAWTAAYPNGVEGTIDSGAGTTSAVLKFEAPEETEGGFYILYGATGTLSSGNLQVTVPATVSGSAKPILGAYTASIEQIAVQLKCLSTYVRVTLQASLSSVRFFAVNNPSERLCGTITLNSSGAVSSSYGTSDVVTVNNPSTTFFVNLLPSTLSKGYVLDFVNSSSQHMIKSISYNASVQLKSHQMIKINAPAFQALSVSSATVKPETTYTRYVAGDLGTANNTDNTNKVISTSTTTTAVTGLSSAMCALVQPTNYRCGSQSSATGTFTNLAQGNHTVTAESFVYKCGNVSLSIPAGTFTGTAIITGIPYDTGDVSDYSSPVVPDGGTHQTAVSTNEYLCV